MNRFIHQRVLLPAFETGLKGRKVFHYWKQLEQTQWLPREELERRQLAALRRLLIHAGTFCPYFRARWVDLDYQIEDIQSLDDFQRIPTMDRETVRENRAAMRSTVPGTKLLSKSTGGSTGVPLHFDYDSDSLDRRFAAWHRGYAWAGAEPGTKQFYFWGVPLRDRSWRQKLKDRAYNGLYRRRVVSSFDFREDAAREILRQFNRYRPDVLVAYTNPLYYLARAIEDQRLQPRSPRAVVVGAEKLYSFQRQLIERVFGAPVFETYGTREFMLLGAECPHHAGLHLTMENCLVEILDDDGQPTPPGEEGNVVVTDLTNYGMPFIRYANGDRAVAGWKSCVCGRGLPLLTQITGRRLDVIRTPDGRIVPGEFFPHLAKDFANLRRFQVVQTSPNCVEMRAIVGTSWSAVDENELCRYTARVLGPEMEFRFLRVSRIDMTSAGKHRVVVGLADPNPSMVRGTS
jgi:phenylacetate-CoA ligase